MPEQIQITLFTFDELSEESQQRVIEGFRQDYDPHYGHIYDEFILEMSEKYGSNVITDDIQWSGFWSQGDGACFTCDFDIEVLLPILKEELNEEQIDILKEIDVEVEASSIRTGFSNHYSHENTVTGNIQLNYGDYYSYRTTEINEIHEIMENKLTEIIREECRNLYSQLRDFYDEEMEEEVIKEKIRQFYPDCRYREDGTEFVR